MSWIDQHIQDRLRIIGLFQKSKEIETAPTLPRTSPGTRDPSKWSRSGHRRPTAGFRRRNKLPDSSSSVSFFSSLSSFFFLLCLRFCQICPPHSRLHRSVILSRPLSSPTIPLSPSLHIRLESHGDVVCDRGIWLGNNEIGLDAQQVSVGTVHGRWRYAVAGLPSRACRVRAAYASSKQTINFM